MTKAIRDAVTKHASSAPPPIHTGAAKKAMGPLWKKWGPWSSYVSSYDLSVYNAKKVIRTGPKKTIKMLEKRGFKKTSRQGQGEHVTWMVHTKGPVHVYVEIVDHLGRSAVSIEIEP